MCCHSPGDGAFAMARAIAPVLSTTDPSSSTYTPTFVGNGYLSARVPAAGAGYSSTPIVTQSELAGFYARSGSAGEQRASLPSWTTLGFGDGTNGGSYGVPGTWSCPFDEICPAAYGRITSCPGTAPGRVPPSRSGRVTPTGSRSTWASPPASTPTVRCPPPPRSRPRRRRRRPPLRPATRRRSAATTAPGPACGRRTSPSPATPRRPRGSALRCSTCWRVCVARLLMALREAGAQDIALPRCGECGRGRPYVGSRTGGRSGCSPCFDKPAVCAGCRQQRRVVSRDRNGDPRCASRRPPRTPPRR